MNYLEEFRVFNIDDYIKNKMFDMFNHEIENTLLNNELNDYSKQLLRASQNIINKMQMEIKKKAKDNPVNDQSKQDE